MDIRIIIRKAVRGLAPGVMAAIMLLAGCSSDECYENKNSLPLAGFYSSDSIPKEISIDYVSIYGIGAPGDSVLHDSVSGLKESYLPFRIDQEQTTYVIQYLQGILGRLRVADTITFDYEIKPWFESKACGASYRYVMRNIHTTHHVIDSVTCPTGEIDNKNAVNLRIYFRVAEEEES